jgi:hypothetical protein
MFLEVISYSKFNSSRFGEETGIRKQIIKSIVIKSGIYFSASSLSNVNVGSPELE